MRRALVVGACLLSAGIGGLLGHARLPADLAVKAPVPGAPYCMVDRELPRFVTVAGPAGGWVTVDGRSHKALTRVTGDYGAEVAPDAGLYDGILYNVPGPGLVAVDGHECEPT